MQPIATATVSTVSAVAAAIWYPFLAEPREVGRQDGRCDAEASCGIRKHAAIVAVTIAAMAKYQMRVEVQPQYLSEQSEPRQGVYSFAYTVTIRNSGEPFDGKRATAQGGTGLENTIRRLDLLYGERHQFHLAKDATGETVASFLFTGERK